MKIVDMTDNLTYLIKLIKVPKSTDTSSKNNSVLNRFEILEVFHCTSVGLT